jgi:D-alanyl-D-alanine carboxypeptidase
VKGTSADIEPGEIYTIHELLHGLMLPSGNDASMALARWGGNVLLLS